MIEVGAKTETSARVEPGVESSEERRSGLVAWLPSAQCRALGWIDKVAPEQLQRQLGRALALVVP